MLLESPAELGVNADRDAISSHTAFSARLTVWHSVRQLATAL
jgi:hypothetical protein